MKCSTPSASRRVNGPSSDGTARTSTRSRAIMWRGPTPGVPIRSGASFVGLGSLTHRVVFYPISQPDATSGLATINWIAEITVDNRQGWAHGDWTRRVDVADFIQHFEGW